MLLFRVISTIACGGGHLVRRKIWRFVPRHVFRSVKSGDLLRSWICCDANCPARIWWWGQASESDVVETRQMWGVNLATRSSIWGSQIRQLRSCILQDAKSGNWDHAFAGCEIWQWDHAFARCGIWQWEIRRRHQSLGFRV
jgi:hypothetical protein